MAGKKVGAVKIKLINPKTGSFYVTKKNPKKLVGKLQRRAYDKVSRAHEIFKEEKI